MMAIGLVELYFDNNMTLFLENYLFEPNFKRNLVSLSCLIKHGLTI